MMMKKKKKKIGTGSRSISSSNAIETNNVFVFELAEDLIMEILPCLPPNSLLRFKSVSKTWYSLISNPDFLRRNTATQFDRRRWWCCINDTLPPPCILLKRYEFAGDSTILTFPPPNGYDQFYHSYFHHKVSPLLLQKLIDFRPEHDYDQHDQVHGTDEKEKFWAVDSCNGLLLYRNSSAKYVFPPYTRKYNLYVCNPITHDYIKLPTFEQEEREHGFKICQCSSPSIVFNPSVSLTYKVFIWLTCTPTPIDYKTMKKKELHYQIYVYSSVTRSWKLSISTNQFPVSVYGLHSIARSVLCNGLLYWIARCPTFHTSVSLCYDVEKDVISTLNFPKMPPEYTYRALLYFGECDGRLRLIETYYKHEHILLQCQFGEKIYVFPSIFDVMEMDNNVDLWTVKYRVNIGDDYYANLIRKQCSSLFRVHILDLYKTKTKNAGEQEVDQGEDVLLLRIGDICIIPFNLSSNTFGKELPYGEKKSVGGRYMGCTEALRYNTITLFPPSSS